jgi:hypothetical protein
VVVGFSVTVGIVPVPVRVKISVWAGFDENPAVYATESVAVSAALVEGVNTTPMAHEAPAARDAVQAGVEPEIAGVATKSVEFVPDTVTGSGTGTAALVLLVKMTL